jgi:hypothetical protein
MVDKLSHHRSVIPVQFDGVLEHLLVVSSLEQCSGCSLSLVEFGIQQIVGDITFCYVTGHSVWFPCPAAYLATVIVLWQMVDKLSHHCCGIPIEFDGVLEHLLVVSSLEQCRDRKSVV